MAILHLDGMDGYASVADFSLEYTITGGANLDPTGGRFGGGVMFLGNGSGSADKALPLTTYTDLWMGFVHRRDRSGGADDKIACFMSPTGVETLFTLNNVTGILKAWRGNASTLLGTATVPIQNSQSVYHFYEFRTKWHGSTGVIEVWADGIQYLNLTGQNTQQNSGASGLSVVRLGSPDSNVWLLYDDFYVLDPLTAPNQVRIGDCRIITLVPNADAGPNNGTLSTGTTHWGVVDELQYNTTDYTDLANTSGQGEYFGMTNLPANANTVYAVKAVAMALKTDAAAMSLAAIVKSNTTEVVGATIAALTTNRRFVVTPQDVDPDTTTAWTPTTVNAMVAGVKVI